MNTLKINAMKTHPPTILLCKMLEIGVFLLIADKIDKYSDDKGGNTMEKEFYIGQPLIIKDTGERVTFAYKDVYGKLPCNVLKNGKYDYRNFYKYDQLEPSPEFKFPEIIAGLEQGYFEVGTEFRMTTHPNVVKVEQGWEGLYLERSGAPLPLTAKEINSMWTLFEPRKEMTLEEIEAELGHKIKLKNYG